MTEFLVNKFIKDSANIESTEVRTRYGMLASVDWDFLQCPAFFL